MKKQRDAIYVAWVWLTPCPVRRLAFEGRGQQQQSAWCELLRMPLGQPLWPKAVLLSLQVWTRL